MVFSTAAKMAMKPVPALDWRMPGFTLQSMKHHKSILPIYFFSAAGCVVCAWYCYKLATYPDTTMFKVKPEVKPTESIPLYTMKSVVDLKSQTLPANRPVLK